MSKNIIIASSAVPDIKRRQDEANYFNPVLGMTNGEYWAREREKCRNNFKYWFKKYIKINRETK